MNDQVLPFNLEINFTYGEAVEIAPGIRRIVANNPSPFTFKGTNTYLLGAGNLAIIDPGPNLDDHFEAIMEAAKGRTITHIILTHTHRDHCDIVPRLTEETGAPLYAFQFPAYDVQGKSGGSTGDAHFNRDLKLDLVLQDQDSITGDGWTLKALYTPGHAPDHLCLSLEERGIVFSGDHVMSWNTSVISPPEGSMSDYIDSLEKLMARDDATYFPGHGGRIENPKRLVKAYLVHRSWRESAILDSVKSGNGKISDITCSIYSDLSDALKPAAERSVWAHLIRLVEMQRIKSEGEPTLDATYYIN